ncbi:hypothetical protein NDU88_006868 [Pleurodeles waltl]|uniref:Uncharacterized protein n=1 Tax=Pleurodeles waltl TaxID=8319 RepID=A0AAV7LQW3_PLEWA|nr:hypothetical protein NDU88_006868 [Pleurodeles waltl]
MVPTQPDPAVPPPPLTSTSHRKPGTPWAAAARPSVSLRCPTSSAGQQGSFLAQLVTPQATSTGHLVPFFLDPPLPCLLASYHRPGSTRVSHRVPSRTASVPPPPGHQVPLTLTSSREHRRSLPVNPAVPSPVDQLRPLPPVHQSFSFHWTPL